MQDISDRKRSEAQREELLRSEHEARVLAETANRIKEDFLAVVSHELRTPLAPMMLWLKALRAGGAGDALRARAIEALDTCLKVQVAMIDDLVDVARGRHGKLRIERLPMDLQTSVGAAIEALAPSSAAKHVSLALEVDSAPAWVLGDATRLQQVTANLLSNAIKFTPEGGHVAVSIRSLGNSVELRVRDDGTGIAADKLERVFEPFRQYDRSPARRHGGLGLGLSIVEQLVAQHEGRVVAESAGLGRGACFTVTLPRHADGTRVVEGPDLDRPLSGVRILVVENEDNAREALAVTLRMEGADVTVAASAVEGRSALAHARPDVVVSDIAMPGEDGYAFIETLRSHESHNTALGRLPAVALTAHATATDRDRALAAGFDDHIAKTVAMERLVSTIHSLARKRDIGA
jgi:CheY-like chemotaxis protein